MKEILDSFADRVSIISFLVGIVFTLAGVIVYLFPPKQINYFYGYRTKSSMKSKDAWDFSQKYSAVRMFLIGIFLFLTSFLNPWMGISQEQSVLLD